MTVVAPRYGLSDVGLVKICKKLGIPVPPRGYWAKVKAGRPTHKLPLPSLPAGARDLAGWIPLGESSTTAAPILETADFCLENLRSDPSWIFRFGYSG